MIRTVKRSECRYPNGNMKREIYYINTGYSPKLDPIHRDGDEPAFIDYYPDGKFKLVQYYHYNNIHRDDGPANIEYYTNGTIGKEVWFKNNRRNRDGDKPAMITYNSDGTLDYEFWFRDDMFHREDDKPARVYYHQNGGIGAEQWVTNNLLHRDGDKPSTISYNEDGSIDYQEWSRYNLKHRFAYDTGSKESCSFSKGPGPFLPKPAIISNKNVKPVYIIYDKFISENQMIIYLYLFRRVILKYKRTKRRELINKLRSSSVGEGLVSNIISKYVY